MRRGGLTGSRLALVLLVAAATFALQLACMSPELDVYDESLLLVGGDRIRHGDIPYRDFWSLYGPAGFVATAGALEIGGGTAVAGRLLDTAIKTAMVGLVWLLARAIARAGTAWLAAAGALAVAIGSRAYGTPSFGATACALAALWLLHTATRAERVDVTRLVLAGGALATAILFRHDLGLYAAIACAVHAFARSRVPIDAVPRANRVVAPFAAGCAAVLAPSVGFLAWKVPAADLLFAFVQAPLFLYAPNRALPFPVLADVWNGVPGAGGMLTALAVRVPFAAVALGVLSEAWRLRRGGPAVPDVGTALRFAALVLAALFVLKGWVRVQVVHMAPALIVSMLVLAGAISAWGSATGRRVALCLAGAVLVAVSARAVVRMAVSGADAPWFASALRLCAAADVPRLRCLALDDERRAAVRHLLASGSAGARVYAAAGRHDKLFIVDLAVPFLAESRVATRWHDLHPGVQTSESVQRAMLAELRQHPPEFVVVDRTWDAWEEPNASVHSSGVTLLDDHLRTAYRETFRSGAISVLSRREATAR